MEGGAVGHNFERTHPGTIPARLGLIWFSSFRREDLNVKVYDVRRMDGRMPSDGKSSHGLWPSELKTMILPQKCIPISLIFNSSQILFK
jgi:hypothetical protein